MKFLVDAQLPKRMCSWIVEAGHQATHTTELPRGNRTTDLELVELADQLDAVLVTKDDDFVRGFLVKRSPRKLLLVATGNISNADLERLFCANVTAIEQALTEGSFVELSHDLIQVRG